MSFWRTITGRSRPKRAQLDGLFMVPSAAVTLQTALGLVPTGIGSVCYRSAVGAGFHQTQQDIVALLEGTADAPEVRISTDTYGFTWLEVRRDPTEIEGLCTDLHVVNTTLELEGFGPGLLCSLVAFSDPAQRRVGLVYLYKKGTFYPFVPSGSTSRDNLLELQVRDLLRDELPIEPELSGWMALWGAPGV